MKHLKLLILILVIGTLQSCIENDIIDDKIEEKLSINNTIEKLTKNTTHQYSTKYTNNIGEITTPSITWSSSNPTIISVSNTGLITGLTEGESIISAKVTTSEGKIVSAENTVTITTEIIDNGSLKEKSGTIRTTSSYVLKGNFTIKEIANTNDLELSIDASYEASSSLPGLYLYLTNNPNTVSGAKEISKVNVYNGDHIYIIRDTNINDFNHLLYWCKPFSVKVGDGEIK